MTFRLPFQIFRTAFKDSKYLTKQFKAQELRHIISRRDYSPIVDVNNNDLAQLSTTKRYISTSLSVQKNRTNLANRKKVRKIAKCTCPRKCQRKLAFRQTTLEDCTKCIDAIRVPVIDPGLHPLQPDYDVSKLKWKHPCPEDDILYKVQRMDDIKGYKVICKELPVITSDCKPCIPFKPTKAPKLGRLRQKYDPSLMKWKHNKPCEPFCIDSIRMDDVCGYKVKDKQLPKLPEATDCRPCLNKPPKKAPKLGRPLRKYDPAKMKWNHPPCVEFCEDGPLRMDDVCGYKIEKKKLPKLPMNDCNPCINVLKDAPKLKRPIKMYDDSQLEMEHTSCTDFCDDAVRMDDVLGYKVVPKCLPEIKSDCIQCIPHIPTIAPELNRPLKKYDDSKMEKDHTYCCEGVCCDVKRSDEGLKIMKKKLPKLSGNDCEPCIDIPTECPKLTRPVKSYDDMKMKWSHTICIEDCICHPPKSDVVNGYKIEKKKLKKYIPSDTCKPCLIFKPTKAPIISRPKMLYDPIQLEQDRNCGKDTCNIDPPRMDNVLGFKVREKQLPKLYTEKCPPCLDSPPKYAPELVRPKRKYDPNNMKWNHTCCTAFCDDIDIERMDDVMGYKVTPKCLPTLATINDCEPCIQAPKYAPKLGRPKLKYNPTLDKPRKCPIDLCDLDPPRMDDVLCWKPKKKILPSINCDTHCKHFSTLALPRITCPKHSYKYNIMRENIRMYGKKSAKGKKTECSKKKKSKCNNQCNQAPGTTCKCKNPECKCKTKTKPVFQSVPKFKVQLCKPRARQDCSYDDQRSCKKTEAPYKAYGDVCNDFYEEPLSECINYNEVMLQPHRQVSGEIKIMKPPPPKFGPVDPEKERRCLEEKQPDPEPLPGIKKTWKNLCSQMKVCPCKPKARALCDDDDDNEKCCTKLNAPYKSFSDRCPQFPKAEPNECTLAEKYKNRCMVSYKKQKSDKEKVCENPKRSKKVDRCVRCGTKIKDVNEEHTCEEIVIPTPASRRVRCSKKPQKKIISKSDKCKGPGKGSSEPKAIKRNKPKSSCDTNKDPCKKKGTLASPKSNGKHSGKECGNSKKNQFSGEYIGSKIIKGQSEPRIQEPMTNSAVLKFSTLVPPLKTTKSIWEMVSECFQPLKTIKSIWEKVCECFQPRSDAPTVHECNQLLLEIKARKAAAAAGLQICEPSCSYVIVDLEKYTQLMPFDLIQTHETDCNLSPCSPSECESKEDLVSTEIKKLELDLKYPKCESSESSNIPDELKSHLDATNTIKLTAVSNINGEKHPKYENSESSYIPDELKSHLDIVSSPVLKTENCNSTLNPTAASTLNKEKNPKCENSESSYIPDELRSDLDVVDSPVLKTENCNSTLKPPAASTLNRENIKSIKNSERKNVLKSSLTYVSKNKYFSTYSRISSKKKQNLSELIMKKSNNLSTKSLNSITPEKYKNFFTKHSPYLRLSNNYIGRIYKLKLCKIGVQNKFLQNYYNEEPFTICHTCKVVPRHEIILNPLLRHIQIPKTTKVK